MPCLIYAAAIPEVRALQHSRNDAALGGRR